MKSTKKEYRRLLRINEAAIYIAYSRAKLYTEIKAGNIKLIKMGHSSRIEITELDRYIDEKAQPNAT